MALRPTPFAAPRELALFPDLAAPPRGEPANQGKNEGGKGRKGEREGGEKGVSSATTGGAAWSSRRLSVRDPRFFPNSNSHKKQM